MKVLITFFRICRHTPALRSPYFEGEEGIALDIFDLHYVTHDGGRTWELDEELMSYYQQLGEWAGWMRAVRAIDRFTKNVDNNNGIILNDD